MDGETVVKHEEWRLIHTEEVENEWSDGDEQITNGTVGCWRACECPEPDRFNRVYRFNDRSTKAVSCTTIC